MTTPSSVWIEADGGSRGNPGPSAYGAVLKDAATGETIAERGETIGVATNNVAEYRGLIAGLELYREHTPGAELEVRMDSRLVVEQMSGTWKIKHPDMKPLALEARRLAPAGTTFTWVPRERNTHADRLANEALDGLRDAAGPVRSGSTTGPAVAEQEEDAPSLSDAEYRGWSGGGTTPTTFVLVRHGVTDHTIDKRFSGGLASSNPGLNDEGRAQVRATAEWLAPVAEDLDAERAAGHRGQIRVLRVDARTRAQTKCGAALNGLDCVVGGHGECPVRGPRRTDQVWVLSRITSRCDDHRPGLAGVVDGVNLGIVVVTRAKWRPE